MGLIGKLGRKSLKEMKEEEEEDYLISRVYNSNSERRKKNVI